MIEASFYTRESDNLVKCELCPHECLLKEGHSGICGVRKNVDGSLMADTYGIIASSSLDPVEKKPLYHYFPGKMIYSIGGYGCNLRCVFCQNHEISQVIPANIDRYRLVAPEEVVNRASIHPNNIGIAYTYNEPVISFEYIKDIAIKAQKKGLKNVMVSNGFINQKPLAQLLEVVDAFNIDLKAFTNEFYKKHTGASINPVLETLKAIGKSGKHLEVTFLVIPDLNDDKNEVDNMFKWIQNELGKETVLHLSRYYPSFKLNKPATPSQTLFDFYEIATDRLDYVYLGNISGSPIGHNTMCRKCSNVLIQRSGYHIALQGVNASGCCSRCGDGPIVKFS